MRNADVINDGKGITEEYLNHIRAVLKNKYQGVFDEDLMQDALIKLLETDKYEWISPVKEMGFIMLVYNNKFLDKKRRDKKFDRIKDVAQLLLDAEEGLEQGYDGYIDMFEN